LEDSEKEFREVERLRGMFVGNATGN